MNIEYIARLPDEDSFFDLYATTGWNEEARKSKEELFWSVTNSWYVVTAYNGEELIGFGRILSDGYLHAVIADMIIAPRYQKKGIGKRILELLVQEAQEREIDNIRLFSTKGNKDFYLKNGFEECPEDIPGMRYISS